MHKMRLTGKSRDSGSNAGERLRFPFREKSGEDS
jgi:hypothetical protein